MPMSDATVGSARYSSIRAETSRTPDDRLNHRAASSSYNHLIATIWPATWMRLMLLLVWTAQAEPWPLKQKLRILCRWIETESTNEFDESKLSAGCG